MVFLPRNGDRSPTRVTKPRKEKVDLASFLPSHDVVQNIVPRYELVNTFDDGLNLSVPPINYSIVDDTRDDIALTHAYHHSNDYLKLIESSYYRYDISSPSSSVSESKSKHEDERYIRDSSDEEEKSHISDEDTNDDDESYYSPLDLLIPSICGGEVMEHWTSTNSTSQQKNRHLDQNANPSLPVIVEIQKSNDESQVSLTEVGYVMKNDSFLSKERTLCDEYQDRSILAEVSKESDEIMICDQDQDQDLSILTKDKHYFVQVLTKVSQKSDEIIIYDYDQDQLILAEDEENSVQVLEAEPDLKSTSMKKDEIEDSWLGKFFSFIEKHTCGTSDYSKDVHEPGSDVGESIDVGIDHLLGTDSLIDYSDKIDKVRATVSDKHADELLDADETDVEKKSFETIELEKRDRTEGNDSYEMVDNLNTIRMVDKGQESECSSNQSSFSFLERLCCLFQTHNNDSKLCDEDHVSILETNCDESAETKIELHNVCNIGQYDSLTSEDDDTLKTDAINGERSTLAQIKCEVIEEKSLNVVNYQSHSDSNENQDHIVEKHVTFNDVYNRLEEKSKPDNHPTENDEEKQVTCKKTKRSFKFLRKGIRK